MFNINGKQYKAKSIDFNAVIEMNELGGDIYKMVSKPFAVLRAYLAYCGGLSADDAGREINAHIVGGGDLTLLSETFNKELETSDFFKVMVARIQEQETEKSEEA